jgi:Xaa-Pro aminopeptidase
MALNPRSVIEANQRSALAAMAEANVSFVISCRPEDVAYLTHPRAFIYRVAAEGRLSEIVVMSGRDERAVLVTMDAYVAYYASKGIDSVPISGFDDLLRATVGHSEGLVAVSGDTPWTLHDRVLGVVGSDRLVLSDPIARARGCKRSDEVELMRETARLSMEGMRAVLEACAPGVAECEVAAAGEYRMRALGAEGFCFSTMVISGPDLGLMRETTTTRVMQHGDWVLVDMGCQKDGYNVEFARSLQIGPATPQYREAYRAVYAAQRAALCAVVPGVSASAVDAAARRSIDHSGFGDYCYQHITGHGIGTGVWEGPTVGPDSADTLLSGMVVAIEPALFIPGVGGIRIEDILVVGKDGNEVLTPFPVLSDLL